MTQRLIIYLDETWPQRPDAPWAVLDERDRVIEHGRSEPRHWPPAASCEAVLGATQASWLQARLPRTAQRHQERVLRYALESQLVKDVEEQHLTVTRRDSVEDGVLSSVIVVGRARLRQILAQLEALGRRPTRLVSELQTAPAASGGAWSLAAGPGAAVVIRSGVERALAVDPAMLDDVLTQLLRQAASDGTPPTALTLHTVQHADATTAGVLAPDPLRKLTGLPCETAPPYPWWHAIHSANDLLHGEFENRQARGRRLAGLRAPLWLAAGAAAVWLAVGIVNTLWQRHQLDGIETRIARLFETALPGTPAIAPAVQLGRALDDLKASHGQLRRDDLLTLLAAYGEIRGASAHHSIAALQYENGLLRLTLNGHSGNSSNSGNDGNTNNAGGGQDDIALLQARFAALGYQFVGDADTPNRATLAVRTTP